jgi:CRP-like cAMP-binding protein
MPDKDMKLTPEEATALLAIDGSYHQRGPPPELEARLRELGLFMTHLLTRNSRVEEDLVDQLFNSSEKRLARTLLLLTNFGKEGGPQPVTTPISQETLAEIVGTTRSRVSVFMNKFRKLGFIEYNGHLQIHSSLMSVLLRE